jgi:uncharacterized membrane protein
MTADAWDLVRTVLRILLALAFLFMGVSHFLPKTARTMAAMIPSALRGSGVLAPLNLVYLTGLCEIAGGIGLLVPALRLPAGIALVVFLAAVFHANAHAARNRQRFGSLAVPFWPRLGAQIVLAALVLWVSLP